MWLTGQFGLNPESLICRFEAERVGQVMGVMALAADEVSLIDSGFRLMAQSIARQVGTIHDIVGDWLADVEFDLWRTGSDIAMGRIWVEGKPEPASHFFRDPAAVEDKAPFLLVSGSGVKIEILFTNAAGTFTCAISDEVIEAALGG